MCSSHQSGLAQQWVLRTYTALCLFRSEWRGNLILSVGLQPRGAALSVAANIAGAVSLAIDSDPMHIREVVRTAACDFVVNTLDEAIRAMKNEVRKGAPLSVALNADVPAALAEIVERGLAPQLFASFVPRNTDIDRATSRFEALGAVLVDFMQEEAPPNNFTDSESIVASHLQRESWRLYTFTFDAPARLRSFDAKALSLLPEQDGLRRRWLEGAPRVLRRQSPPTRSLWLTETEATALASGFPNAIPAWRSSDLLH